MKHPVPDGDVLIHAGDATMRGTLEQVGLFAEWFKSLPHKYKLFVPGNHDFLFENNASLARSIILEAGALTLIDEGVVIDGVRFWGSPYQPWFMSWAFNVQRGAQLAEHWAEMPSDTDVLITHSPPYSIGDTVPSGEKVGCEDLLARVRDVRPTYHVFGHIHEGYGVHGGVPGVSFVNASICDGSYRPINAPISLEF